jgi:hypothetical protein
MISFFKRLFSKKVVEEKLPLSKLYPEIDRWFRRYDIQQECIRNMRHKVIVRSRFESGNDASVWFHGAVIPWLEETMEYKHNYDSISHGYGYIDANGSGWTCVFPEQHLWYACLSPLTVQFEFSFSDLQTATHFRLRF